MFKAAVEADRNCDHAGGQYRSDRRLHPSRDDYDHEIIIISTLRLDKIQVLTNSSRWWHCRSSNSVSGKVLKPLGRGAAFSDSSCIGANRWSAGFVNNSGVSLVQRGPAYTNWRCTAALMRTAAQNWLIHLGIDLDPRRKKFWKLSGIPAVSGCGY